MRSHAISGARRLPSRVLLALALALLLRARCCAVTASPASQLQACFNRNASAQAPYYFEDYVTGRPSRLTIHSVLWSTKLQPKQEAPGNSSSQAAVPAYPLTIATMTNQHRLSNLEAQCNSWPGPLTVAVYVPLLLGNETGNAASLLEMQAVTQQLFDRVEANPTSCAMRLLLVTEMLGEQSALLLFPINSLRNMALLTADAPLVAMIDVDLVLSSTLSDEFSGLAGRRGNGSSAAEVMRLCRSGSLLILPAFEFCEQGEHDLPKRTAMAAEVAMGGKAKLVELVREQRMCMFMATWQKGHGATQFPIWYSSPWPYTVQHNSMFEPWYIVDRFRNPWYDARFRGYGMDKQQQVTAAALDRKLTFMVHPTAFVVHMPHKKPQTFRQYMSAVAARKFPIGDHVKQVLASMHSQAVEATHKPTSSNLSAAEVGVIMRKQNEELFHASERHMRRGGSTPSQLDPQMQACLSELPWWQAQPAGESATHLNPPGHS